MTTRKEQFLFKGTGLIIAEARNTNQNGDPDQDGAPRTRMVDGLEFGEATSVSLKRKFRDLVSYKEGPVWGMLQKRFGLDPAKFSIVEERGRDLESLYKLSTDELLSTFWDIRIFGTTLLEEKDKRQEDKKDRSHTHTGPFVVGHGVSVAPVVVSRETLTKKAGVEQDKDRGMAPDGLKIIEHALFHIPLFFNPSDASKTACTKRDVDVLLAVMPYVYSHTASSARSIHLIRAWYADHKNALGSCREYEIIDALAPKKISNPDKPSTSLSDYDIPKQLNKDLLEKLTSIKDYSEPEKE